MNLRAGTSVPVRALLALLAAAVIVSAVVLFADHRNAPACTHGISSAGPVTIVGGKVHFEHKTYTKACLL